MSLGDSPLLGVVRIDKSVLEQQDVMRRHPTIHACTESLVAYVLGHNGIRARDEESVRTARYFSNEPAKKSEVVELPRLSHQVNQNWYTTIRQCTVDLITHGFSIVRFIGKESMTMESIANKSCVGLSKDFYAPTLSTPAEKIEVTFVDNIEGAHEYDCYNITGTNFVRVDPLEVDIYFRMNSLRGELDFMVKKLTDVITDCFVIYDPLAFSYGKQPVSLVRIVLGEAMRAEQIQRYNVKAQKMNANPSFVVVSAGSKMVNPSNLESQIPLTQQAETIQFRSLEQKFNANTSINAAATIMAINGSVNRYSDSGEPIAFFRDESDMSMLLPPEVPAGPAYCSNPVLAIPPGQDIRILETPGITDSVRVMEASHIAIGTGMGTSVPTITQHLSNVGEQVLRLVMQSLSNRASTLRAPLVRGLEFLFNLHSEEFVIKTKGGKKNKPRTVIFEFVTSNQTDPMALYNAFNSGAISEDLFVAQLLDQNGWQETDPKFKPLCEEFRQKRLEEEGPDDSGVAQPRKRAAEPAATQKKKKQKTASE